MYRVVVYSPVRTSPMRGDLPAMFGAPCRATLHGAHAVALPTEIFCCGPRGHRPPLRISASMDLSTAVAGMGVHSLPRPHPWTCRPTPRLLSWQHSLTELTLSAMHLAIHQLSHLKHANPPPWGRRLNPAASYERRCHPVACLCCLYRHTVRDIGCAEHAAAGIDVVAHLMQSCSIDVLAVQEMQINHGDDVPSAFGLEYHGTAGPGFLVRSIVASHFAYSGPG